MPCWLSEVLTKPLIASLMVLAMVLTWVMLPMPKEARPPKRAKMTASHFHLGPRPFLM